MKKFSIIEFANKFLGRIVHKDYIIVGYNVQHMALLALKDPNKKFVECREKNIYENNYFGGSVYLSHYYPEAIGALLLDFENPNFVFCPTGNVKVDNYLKQFILNKEKQMELADKYKKAFISWQNYSNNPFAIPTTNNVGVWYDTWTTPVYQGGKNGK